MGFGGSCFKKDILALIYLAESKVIYYSKLRFIYYDKLRVCSKWRSTGVR